MEGNGYGLICVTIPAFVWRGWVKPRKTPVSRVGFLTGIRTRHVSNPEHDFKRVLIVPSSKMSTKGSNFPTTQLVNSILPVPCTVTDCTANN
jgi:hypothetical protein